MLAIVLLAFFVLSLVFVFVLIFVLFVFWLITGQIVKIVVVFVFHFLAPPFCIYFVPFLAEKRVYIKEMFPFVGKIKKAPSVREYSPWKESFWRNTVLKILATRQGACVFALSCIQTDPLQGADGSFETQIFRLGAITKSRNAGALRDFFVVLGRKRWFQNRFFPIWGRP